MMPLVLSFVFAALAAAPTATESHLDAAVRLTGEGNLRAALAEARAETGEPDRSQAFLYVLHHAGALEEALAAGLSGLELEPEETWLLDRCAYIAISLGAGELARELCVRLRSCADEETWRRSSWMLAEADRLLAERRREESSIVRARWTVAGGLLLAAGCAALLARSRKTACQDGRSQQAEVT
jgi:hypothetical protein